MAASVTFDAQPGGRSTMFPRKIRRGTLTLGASYATGGVAITPALFGLTRIDDIDIQPSAGYLCEWLPSTGKVKAYYDNSAGAYTQNQPLGEVANAANLSAVNFRFRAEGV